MRKRPSIAGHAEATVSALHQVEVAELKGKLADANERYKHAVALYREADDRLNAILGLKEAVSNTAPKHLKVKASGKSGESTAVLVASDWHVEERVDPRGVDGVNEYSPEIAEERVTRFFQTGLSMVEMCRTRGRIDTLVLAVLGDLITNTIHDDLAESNYLSPTEASLKAYRLLCGGIDFLLREGRFKKILVPCCVGNHGRTTRKPRVSTATRNSYEWLMYHVAAERYAGDARVEFSVTDGYFNFLDVYGYTVRFHHGDAVKYQGGVGGVTIPLNKAIAQWNKMRKVYLDVLGHWHTQLSGREFVLNGSLIGYNAYSIAIKASYEPPSQSFFTIHPRYGKAVEIPIHVE